MSTMTMSSLTVSSPTMNGLRIDQVPPGAPGRPTARQRSTVRLTRRGRAVVLVLALIAVLAVGIAVAGGSVATGHAGTPEPTAVVQVGPGDTLWAIAAAAADDGDVASMMNRIEKLNALDSGMLVSGQKLLIPTD
jgi:LysM repeat protein